MSLSLIEVNDNFHTIDSHHLIEFICEHLHLEVTGL